MTHRPRTLYSSLIYETVSIRQREQMYVAMHKQEHMEYWTRRETGTAENDVVCQEVSWYELTCYLYFFYVVSFHVAPPSDHLD